MANKQEFGESGTDDGGSSRRDDRSKLALAGQWVSRIMTVSFEMVVPGLIGLAVDRRLGWRFPVLGLLGFGLGITAGIWHLTALTANGAARATRGEQRSKQRGKAGGDDFEASSRHRR